jgi:hypothetical protein
LDRKVTKKEVLRVKDATADAAKGVGLLSYVNWQPGPAAKAMVKVAIAVSFPASSEDWEEYISQALVEAIIAVEDRATEKEWQRRKLLALLGQTVQPVESNQPANPQRP